jgi:ATP-binding cassette subfamily F protein 3
VLSIENLSVEFSARPLFTDISYVINKNDHIALVGRNGAGKSTMLKILAGIQQPTSGRVNRPKDLTIGYLPQVMNLTDTLTVRQETEQAFSGVIALEAEEQRLSEALSQRTDYECAEYHELIDRLTTVGEHLTMANASNRAAEIERTLSGLGFERTDFDRPTAEFSGGWRMRIELAKILLRRPDVLLLDEPTNHLDIQSIQWLERFLTGRSCTLVLISHDRAFLDNVTTRTIEITCGTIHDYAVPYSRYVVLHQERLEQQRRAYENQQKMIEETRAFIERFRYQATKAIQVQSRIKQLEKVVPIEIDEVDNSRLRLTFPPAPRSGDFPVICDDVAKRYGAQTVFEHVDLTIRRGEKVAFVGRNGEGKSTLVKCIMGEIPFEGQLKIGHGVRIGYFAQNQAQLLDGELTVFDTIDRVATGDIRTRIKDILGAFMFGGEAIEKKVKVLSGGERSRLAMIRLLLEPVNLLILDEPTNHLDIASKEVLKQAICAFDGTVIVVSHDRDFLDGTVSKVYEFAHGRVREHLGGIYQFLAEAEAEQAARLAPAQRAETPKPASAATTASKTAKPTTTPAATAPTATTPTQPTALSFEAQKELKRQRQKVERDVHNAEVEIARLEAEIARTESEMMTPEGSSNPDLFKRHAALKQQLDAQTDAWMLASEQLENL